MAKDLADKDQDYGQKSPNRMDVANLVIGFVGVVAICASIAGAVAGAFGFSTFNDILSQARAVEQRVSQQQDKITEQQENISKTVNEFQLWQSRVRDEVNALHKSHANFYISQRISEFQNKLDDLRIDEMHRSIIVLRNLERIVHDIVDKERFPDRLLAPETSSNLSYIDRLWDTIKYYKQGDYSRVVGMFPGYTGDAINVHRFLVAAHNHLFDDTKDQNHIQKMEYHAKRYNQLLRDSGRKSLIAQNQLIMALLKNGSSNALEEAEGMVARAVKDYPSESILWYNYAALLVKKNKFEGAIDKLQNAKKNGDFQTTEDKEFFCTDPDMRPLREALPEKLGGLLGGHADIVCSEFL